MSGDMLPAATDLGRILGAPERLLQRHCNRYALIRQQQMLPVPPKGEHPHDHRGGLGPGEDPVSQATHEGGSGHQQRALVCELGLAHSVGLEGLVCLHRTAAPHGVRLVVQSLLGTF